jgi:hypothetical protein
MTPAKEVHMHRLVISCLAIVGLTAMLHADVWNKKTELTVNQTIEVPGATLTPGKYVVKLVDSQANRHIVQFMNKTEDEVISTVLAIPNERLKPTGKSEFSFYETPVGDAPALRAWFYPGDTFGQEFAYPERRASELAKATGEEVPSMTAQDVQSAEVTTPSPKADRDATAGKRTTPAAEPNNEPAPQPAPRMMAQAQRPPAQEPTRREEAATPSPQPRQQPAGGEAEPSELPATASPAPLLGLIGLLSLGGAWGLRLLSKHQI